MEKLNSFQRPTEMDVILRLSSSEYLKLIRLVERYQITLDKACERVKEKSKFHKVPNTRATAPVIKYLGEISPTVELKLDEIDSRIKPLSPTKIVLKPVIEETVNKLAGLTIQPEPQPPIPSQPPQSTVVPFPVLPQPKMAEVIVNGVKQTLPLIKYENDYYDVKGPDGNSYRINGQPQITY